MDPNANLQEQERIIAANAIIDARGRRDIAVSERLRHLRISLTQWIAGGGFHPDWTACPLAARYFRRAGILRTAPEWSGRCCDLTPDTCWIDDATGLHRRAPNGEPNDEHNAQVRR
jgi:hypothetical protein